MLQLRLPPFKRLLLLALTATMVGFGLSGCGRGGQEQVTIHFWNGFTGPDGRTMLAMVRKFNEENPDVRIVMQRMAWNTYYNKLFVAGPGGRAPEMFVLHNGNYYALPLDAYILGIYYNRDLFRRAGIVDDYGEPVHRSTRWSFSNPPVESAIWGAPSLAIPGVSCLRSCSTTFTESRLV